MLEQIIFKNTIHDWIISLVIIAGGLLLNKGIVLLNKYVIQKVTVRTKNRLDDILFKMLESPVLLGITLFTIWIAAKRLDLGAPVESMIAKSFRVLTVVNITWFVARLVKALIEEYLAPKAEQADFKRLDIHLMSIIRRTALGVIWALGIVTALTNAGLNVGALITGLGIGGLAFALAAQDTIKNIFGGFTIFTDRPFRIGDQIKVDGFNGFVEEIGIRSTRIRTLEKRIVTIPNYKIVEASVENISNEPMHLVAMKLRLNYKTDPAKMNEAIVILKDIALKLDGVDSTTVTVGFTEFTEFAMIISFSYFIKKEADIMVTTNLVNSEILVAFNKADLQFAFPTQTVYLEKEIGNEVIN
jgi:MscS family membrane protein